MATAVTNCAIIKKEGQYITIQIICPKCGRVTTYSQGFVYEGTTYVFTQTCGNLSCYTRFEVQFIG